MTRSAAEAPPAADLVRLDGAEPGSRRMRLIGMRVTRLMLIVGVALVATGCGAGSSGTSTAPGHGGAQSSAKIRGNRLTAFTCPANGNAAGVEVSFPASALAKIRLCPLSTVQQQGASVTLGPTDPSYAAIVASLTLPDQKPTGNACPMFADLPQIVIGQTSSGAALIHIPVDGCGHYLSQPLAALTAARNAANGSSVS